MSRLVVALALLPLALRAQQVAGVVSRNGTPVEGAVVLLLDANGREVGRTASHEDGRYQLSAVAGQYRLQVLQIGWRPANIGSVELRPGVTTKSDLALQSAPVALLGVNVTGRQQCSVRPDSSGKAFAVWEAARAALLATSLTGAESFDVHIVRNERTLVDDGKRVLEDTTETTSGKTVSPFRSLSPRVLADSGYVTMTPDRGRMFWAPDADVLLSEEFLSRHCLELSETPGDAQRIALRFTPTSKRSGIVDVEGLLHVDRKTGELRDLEYRYVNGSDAIKNAEAGGEVRFLRIPRGRWVVSHWVIRYPLIGTRRMYTGAIVPGQRAETRSHDELEGIKLTTATLLDMSRSGVKLWERGRVSFAARVLDSMTNEPRPNVLVGFAGSGDATATDSSGIVRFDLVDPGSPVLRLDDPSLRALGVKQLLRVVDVPDFNDAIVTVRIPSARMILASQCGSRALTWGEGILSGQLRPSDTSAVVVVSSTPFIRLGRGSPVEVEKYMEIQPAKDGSFRVCGIPRDASLRVRRSTDPAGSGRVVRFDPGALGVNVSLPD